MNRATKTVAGMTGVALAAAAIYLFDPDNGKRRRSELGTRCKSAARRINDESHKLGHQISDRYHNAETRVSSWFDKRSRADGALARRVRVDLWREVPGLRGVGVIAHDGQIILHGDVPPQEHQHVLQVVGAVEGVVSVADHLNDRANGSVVGQRTTRLRGALTRFKDGFTEERWSPPARVCSGAVGLALLRWGATHRNFVGGIGALTGAVLLVRSSTNTPFKQLVSRGKRAAEESPALEAVSETATHAADGLHEAAAGAQSEWRRRTSVGGA
jgi:gas vesicle protein